MERDVAIDRMRSRTPPWDDLEQRRLLGRVHVAHAQRLERRRTRRRGGMLAAGVVLLLLGGWALSSRPEPEVLQPSAHIDVPVVATASTESTDSRVTLADGSRATLSSGAVVDTQVQRDDLVQLSQASGRVHYDVRPNPARAFVVHVGAYQVRVLGTAFVVDVSQTRLEVEVERGRVEVVTADRSLILGAGERIDLPRDAVPIPAEEVEPDPDTNEAEPASLPSASRLLERADAARRKGRLGDAASALRRLVEAHRHDARVPSAWFMLGRVEQQRGKHVAAARAFARAWKSGTSRALIEDARAEEALAWERAGSHDRARKAARAYLAAYPSGTHRSRVQAIVP